MKQKGSAPGKIILTGEHAVVFGFPGIAIPSPLRMDIAFDEDRTLNEIVVRWNGITGDEAWDEYLKEILNIIQQFKGKLLQGRLTIINEIPLGKGMGSSTSLVIAASRCLFGEDCREEALAIENRVNPGHSGIDFNVIWEGKPLLFKKGEDPQEFSLPKDILDKAMLIDTGKPNETTAELVAFVSRSRSSVTSDAAFKTIGNCTERLMSASEVTEPILREVLPDHHRAQVALGVVPEEVQKLISQIEESGGAAKVLGAGARTGGGGMVLALHKNPRKIEGISAKHKLQSLFINE